MAGSMDSSIAQGHTSGLLALANEWEHDQCNISECSYAKSHDETLKRPATFGMGGSTCKECRPPPATLQLSVNHCIQSTCPFVPHLGVPEHHTFAGLSY